MMTPCTRMKEKRFNVWLQLVRKTDNAMANASDEAN